MFRVHVNGNILRTPRPSSRSRQAGNGQHTTCRHASADPPASVALTNNVTFTFAAGARTIHETDQDSYGGTCVNTLTLRDADDNIVNQVSYRSEFPWPIEPAAQPSYREVSGDRSAAWGGEDYRDRNQRYEKSENSGYAGACVTRRERS